MVKIANKRFEKPLIELDIKTMIVCFVLVVSGLILIFLPAVLLIIPFKIVTPPKEFLEGLTKLGITLFILGFIELHHKIIAEKRLITYVVENVEEVIKKNITLKYPGKVVTGFDNIINVKPIVDRLQELTIENPEWISVLPRKFNTGILGSLSNSCNIFGHDCCFVWE